MAPRIVAPPNKLVTSFKKHNEIKSACVVYSVSQCRPINFNTVSIKPIDQIFLRRSLFPSLLGGVTVGAKDFSDRAPECRGVEKFG